MRPGRIKSSHNLSRTVLTALLLTIPPTVMIGVGAAFVLVGLFGDHRPIDLLALLGWLAIGAALIWVMRRRREALTGGKAIGPGTAGFEPRAPSAARGDYRGTSND